MYDFDGLGLHFNCGYYEKYGWMPFQELTVKQPLYKRTSNICTEQSP